MTPSCAQSSLATTTASQQGAVSHCLERLRRASGHFQAKRLAFEIRDVGFTPAGSLETLQLLVRWIFDRAMKEPERLAGPAAALCYSLTPILPTFKPPSALTVAAKAKRIDFRQILLNLCQREFEAAFVSAISESDIPKTAATPDGTLSGSLQFLAQLYWHNLLTDRIMLSCLEMVASGRLGGGGDGGGSINGSSSWQPLRGANVLQRVECLARALLISGRQLDECLADQYRPVLDGLFNHLAVFRDQETPDMSPDVQDLLTRVLGLRAEQRANGGGFSVGVCDAELEVAATRASNGVSTGGGSCSSNSCIPASSAAAATKLGKAAGGMTVHRSSGRITVAAPGLATRQPGSPSFRVTSPGPVGGSEVGGGGTVDSAAEEVVVTSAAAALMMRQHRFDSTGSMSSMLSRHTSQNLNLEGLWDLTPETYNDVRGQLISQPISNSPATLEAMADELVESAVAVSGGNVNCPCWGWEQGEPGQQQQHAVLTDEGWAELMRQQWDVQHAACDIYVQLCVDVLQQMYATTPSTTSTVTLPAAEAAAVQTSASSEGRCLSPSIGFERAAELTAAVAVQTNGCGAAPPAAPVVSEMGRAFRRLLLSATQTHFERCLAAMLPVPSSPCPSPSPSPSSDASLPPSAAVEVALLTPPVPPSPAKRAWGDMPGTAPDTASALPRARGSCHLLLGLLRHGILTPRILLHCAAALVEGAAGGSVGCLQCACILLAGVCPRSQTFKVEEQAAFKSLLTQLQDLTEDDNAAGADAFVAQVQRRRFVSWLLSELRLR